MFFDLEGDAFAADGGLEYLFGVADRDGNYNPSWALDPASEKRVFERFIDDVMARWEHHPGFHIYHYGAYETTAVKRLMSRYATREDEVDRLLRGRVFVDLHRVVRQGLRASVESYSIKKLEPFYGFARAVDLATATRALIQVEARLELGDAAGVPDSLRVEIEGYNRDDCLSTLRLAAWLEERRRELQGLTGQPVPRPALRDEARDREQEPAVETAPLFEALTAGLPVDDAELDDEQRARWLLAHLLEFHRREDKSMWWEFFHRCGFTEEEHVESRATLGALTYEGEAGQVKRSVIHRYRFPEQPHEVKVGDSPKNPDTAESDELKRGFCGTVVALARGQGRRLAEEPRHRRIRRAQAGVLRHRGRTGRDRRHDRPETRPQLARAAPGGAGAARQRPEHGVAEEPRPARRSGRVRRPRGGQPAPGGVRPARPRPAPHRAAGVSTERVRLRRPG